MNHSRSVNLLISTAIIIAMIISFIPPSIHTYAEDITLTGVSGDFVYIVLDDNTCAISGYLGTDTDITIPYSIKQYKVVDIYECAFYKNSNVASVTIIGSVTNIGHSAFYGCSNLKDVTINNGVKTIGGSAFRECKNLAKVSMPYSLMTIGENAFMHCRNLSDINIPLGVTSIGSSAFAYCESLTAITIPKSVTIIEDATFYYCKNLTSVSVSNGLLQIGDCAFQECRKLNNILIPESTVSIGDQAFKYCSKLQNLELSKNLASVGDEAFFYCGLTQISLPDSITHIGKDAFNCPNLTFLMYGNTKYLGNKGNPYLALITNRGTEFTFDAVEYTYTIHPNTKIIADNAFSSCTFDTLKIPNNVQYIGDHAFSGCNLLTAIELPEHLISLGNHSFRSCSQLTTVSVPKNVKEIGESAFEMCYGLTEVSLGQNVAVIGPRAFSSCSSLSSIEIGETIQSIGSSAFSGCYKLENIYFLGPPPSIGVNAFYWVNATAYYPVDKGNWTADNKQNYGGNINWIHLPGNSVLTGTISTSNISEYPVELILYSQDNTLINSMTVTQETYTFSNLLSGKYTVVVEQPPHISRTYHIELDSNHNHTLNVVLCSVGDINSDTVTNVIDIAMLYSHIRQTSQIIDRYALKCADANHDGAINIGDVAKLYSYIKGNTVLF